MLPPSLQVEEDPSSRNVKYLFDAVFRRRRVSRKNKVAAEIHEIILELFLRVTTVRSSDYFFHLSR